MQTTLFEDINPPKNTSLNIKGGTKKQLSKNQLEFNKLTQKIEKLNKEIERKKLQFDAALSMYATALYPAQLKVFEARNKLIITLWGIYRSKKLSKPNQRQLKQVMVFHLQESFAQHVIEPSKELQDIFSALSGVSYEQAKRDEAEMIEDQMKAHFARMKVDIDGIDLKDEAAIVAKLAEYKQQIEIEEAAREEKRMKRKVKKPKSNKQEEYEKLQQAVQDAKQKNIGSIYRQLAKIFHPDLEQDAEKKVAKEILMKELTAAYEAKNLHTLLSLELKWIYKESSHLETLADDKLLVYLQLLKEQVSNLAYEKLSIYEQPQYGVLVQQFGPAIQSNPIEVVQQQVNMETVTAISFEEDIVDFKSDKALRYVDRMIKQWKEEMYNASLDEENEIFSRFFS
jgi:hypothetical protein